MKGLDTKYRFSPFSIYDYRFVEEYFAAMAAKGWMIESIGGFLWRFKKTEPSEKTFAAFFPANASDYKPIPVESDTLLKELCVKGGWERVAEWRQLQVFCAGPEAPPMETDEAVRLESIHRSMKKTFVPAWIFTIIAMLLTAFSNGMRYFGDTSYGKDTAGWFLLISLYTAFTAGMALLGYLIWLKSSRQSIAGGGTCVSAAWHRRLLNVLMIGLAAAFAGFFLYTVI